MKKKGEQHPTNCIIINFKTLNMATKYCLQQLPIQMNDGSEISAEVWQDEYNFWHYKAKYPKVGRSHYYAVVNYIDSLFDEQYPYWAEIFHKQSRGE